MTNDEISNAIEVMKASLSGKKIQINKKDEPGEWTNVIYPCFNFFNYQYRIKPEPKLRPYNAEEMSGLVGKVLTYQNNKDKYLVMNYISIRNTVELYYIGKPYQYTAKMLLENWSLDGKPCGVEE